MIAENLKEIQTRIQGAKPILMPQLVAVSKNQNAEKIEEALEAGLRIFGENKVQEAITHWAHLKSKIPDLELHLIGALQTNKVRDAVKIFDVIQTLDRIKLAEALASEMQKQNKFLPCFIQVNTGEEPQKAGVIPQDLSALLNACKALKLNIIGLMCVPPVGDAAGIHFTFLKKLARRYGLANLSMGMSADLEQAVKAGATHIRVGTSLFGERA